MAGVCVYADVQVLADIRRIVDDSQYTPTDPSELCNRLLTTCYMGTSNSSQETNARAKTLASQIGRFYTSYLVAIALSHVGCINEFLY